MKYKKFVVICLLFIGVGLSGRESRAELVRGPNNELAVGLLDPDEVQTITGDFNLYGDLYILNNGTLTISGSHFESIGNIYVQGTGTLRFENSTLTLFNGRNFNFNIYVLENATLEFTDSEMATHGYNSHLNVMQNGSVILDNSSLSDNGEYNWVIANFMGNSSLTVNNSNIIKEVVPSDSATIYIKNDRIPATAIAVWVNADYDVRMKLHDLKTPYEKSTVSIFPSDPDISGIDYSIEVVDSNIYWLINAGFFTDIRLFDSEVSIVLFLYGYNGIDFDEMGSGYYESYQLPLYEFERVLMFERSSVIFWQLYLSGVGNEYAETFRITNSEVNELLVFDQTYVSVKTSILGPAAILAMYEGGTVLAVTDTVVRSFVAAAIHDAKIYFEGCTFEGTEIIASDDAEIYLKQVKLIQNIDNPLIPVGQQATLKARGKGRVFVAIVDEIGSTPYNPGDRVPLSGSADIIFGAASTETFQEYRFQYSLRGSDIWEEMGTTYTTPVSDGSLGEWDTTDMAPGEYLVRLIVKDSEGKKIESFGALFLE